MAITVQEIRESERRKDGKEERRVKERCKEDRRKVERKEKGKSNS